MELDQTPRTRIFDFFTGQFGIAEFFEGMMPVPLSWYEDNREMALFRPSEKVFAEAAAKEMAPRDNWEKTTARRIFKEKTFGKSN